MSEKELDDKAEPVPISQIGIECQTFQEIERELIAPLSNLYIKLGNLRADIKRLRTHWEATPEISQEKYKSVVVLLEAFASQLSEAANRLIDDVLAWAGGAAR